MIAAKLSSTLYGCTLLPYNFLTYFEQEFFSKRLNYRRRHVQSISEDYEEEEYIHTV